MIWKRLVLLAIFLTSFPVIALVAQEVSQTEAAASPAVLTLKRAIGLALQNSRDIQLARIQAGISEKTANVTKSEFMPNLYAGSGAGYTYGIPETPGGRAPSVFSVTYTENIFNGPLRGLAKEQQENARAQRIMLDDTRNAVMARVATAYFELIKVHHSLELLRKEQGSADKIVQVTQERQGEGYELPMEVTRAQLTRAQIVQRVFQLEGRQDEIEVFLRNQLGLAPDQPIEVTSEELPGMAEQEGATLVALAAQSNPGLLAAESDVRAKEFRLTGEKRGRLPTLQLVSVYSLLAKFNNYTDYFTHFQYNNFNAGVSVQVPIYSAKTRAEIALAKANLDASKVNLDSKRKQVSAEMRQKSRKVQEADAAKDVARLELQLSQQSLAVLQSKFDEGNINLRDIERARLDESDKWMSYLDANFQKQQAQLELLRTAGQLDKVLE
jgi:outer membrane protein TolC